MSLMLRVGRGVWGASGIRGIWESQDITESQTGISGVTINQISKNRAKFYMGYHKSNFKKMV